jgi:Predicted phosphohydrolases
MPVILLDHRPGLAAKSAAAGVDLQLSGHTHGGLVRGLDYIIGTFNAGYYSGLYDVNGMKLFVSNGAGLWLGFSARLGVPSEVTKITLRAVK